MDELAFWKTCCERGITICDVPKPFQETRRCWLVVKFVTFADRNTWQAAHTFDSEAELRTAVEAYFATGVEPKLRAAGR